MRWREVPLRILLLLYCMFCVTWFVLQVQSEVDTVMAEIVRRLSSNAGGHGCGVFA